MSQEFKFKQFSVSQDNCAMKIGTDGVLLGAWSTVGNNEFSVLDIGAATGVVALMLAQRSFAEVVDALEIDDKAYEQCVSNFEKSIWGDRLFCYHASLQEFAEEIEDKYDLIVSNPPFYSEDYKTDNEQRDLARFQDAMPFDHLVVSVKHLLSETGRFCTIIPFSEESKFVSLANQVGLQLNKCLHVKGNPDAPVKRSLLEFSLNETELVSDELTIEVGRHEYTDAYKALTKDFYLKF